MKTEKFSFEDSKSSRRAMRDHAKAVRLHNRAAAAIFADALAIVPAGSVLSDAATLIGFLDSVLRMSARQRQDLQDRGAEILSGLTPMHGTTPVAGGPEVLVRLAPGDIAVVPALIALGLRRSKRGSTALELRGVADPAAVAAVVDPVGGTVTVIAPLPGEAAQSHRADPDEAAARAGIASAEEREIDPMRTEMPEGEPTMLADASVDDPDETVNVMIVEPITGPVTPITGPTEVEPAAGPYTMTTPTGAPAEGQPPTPAAASVGPASPVPPPAPSISGATLARALTTPAMTLGGSLPAARPAFRAPPPPARMADALRDQSRPDPGSLSDRE